jgi:hypothetical protein
LVGITLKLWKKEFVKLIVGLNLKLKNESNYPWFWWSDWCLPD